MEIMTTIKFVVLYGSEIFVITVVGATVLAGLYQLIRDQVRGAIGRRRESRVPAPVVGRKSE